MLFLKVIPLFCQKKSRYFCRLNYLNINLTNKLSSVFNVEFSMSYYHNLLQINMIFHIASFFSFLFWIIYLILGRKMWLVSLNYFANLIQKCMIGLYIKNEYTHTHTSVHKVYYRLAKSGAGLRHISCCPCDMKAKEASICYSFWQPNNSWHICFVQKWHGTSIHGVRFRGNSLPNHNSFDSCGLPKKSVLISLWGFLLCEGNHAKIDSNSINKNNWTHP